MYEELVKLARHCSEIDACINCPVSGCEGTTGIMNRLADAIEELSKRINRAVELYDSGVERSAMYEALKGISPEPPKKEK